MITEETTRRIPGRRVLLMLLLLLALALIMSNGPAAMAAADTKAVNGARLNAVQCPNQPDGETCIGTKGTDLLVGTEEFDFIQGRGGADIYDGKGGGDDYFDRSKRSSDLYIIPPTEFNSATRGGINIIDRGGRSDVLDLSAYSSTDFAVSKVATEFDNLLVLKGPGNRSIGITSFFTRNTIDQFKFSDVTLTAKEMKQKVQ